MPVICGTLARFECRRHMLHDAGDHTIVVGLVRRAARRKGEPCASRAGLRAFRRENLSDVVAAGRSTGNVRIYWNQGTPGGQPGNQ